MTREGRGMRARGGWRGLALAALIATGLGASGGAARAEADGPDHFRVTGVAADDELVIRAAASPKARRLGAVPHDGDGLRNLGCRGGLSFAQWEKASPAQRARAQRARWCRIEYRGVTGWVAGRYLGEGSPPR